VTIRKACILFLDDESYLTIEYWDFGCECVPYYFQVYAEILMNYDVEAPGNPNAINIGILLSTFFRNVFDGFTNNFQIS
jgi:hypothetical protein